MNPWAALVGGGVWVLARRVRPGVRVQVALAVGVVALVAGGFSTASRLVEMTSASARLRAAVERLERLVEEADGTTAQRDTAKALLAEARQVAGVARREEGAAWLCRGDRAEALREAAGAWVEATRKLDALGGVRLSSPLEDSALEARRAAAEQVRRAIEKHESFFAATPSWMEECLLQREFPAIAAANARLKIEEELTRDRSGAEELKRRARHADQMSVALAILAREAGRYSVADGAPVFADAAAQSEWDEAMDRLEELEPD